MLDTSLRRKRRLTGHLGDQKVEKNKNDKVLIVPDRTIAFNELHDVTVVGKAADLDTLVDFDHLLRIVWTVYSKLQYLGGLYILLSFEDSVAAKKFLKAKTVWGLWFSKLELWSAQSLPLERVAWLKILGVPLHILDSDVLASISGLFGKVLHVPKNLVDDQDLSFKRVGILVEEELEEWVPDCLGVSVRSSSDEESLMQSSPVGQMAVSGKEGVEETVHVNSSTSMGESRGSVSKKFGDGWDSLFGKSNEVSRAIFSGHGPEASNNVKNDIFVFSTHKKF
ncbi:hypothetical protein Hanom_Chr08g00756291 [Helianthus anomalus]